VETHAITSHFALPLLIKSPGGLVVEVNDGTAEYNATHYRVSFFYDLAKASVNRMAFALAHEVGLTARPPCRSRRGGCDPRRCSTRMCQRIELA
jgi:NAD(P)-dependent dehydrogenase (short-subunit alcohol dehydrogenase family)